jgi:general secretion pathway protein L
MQNIIVWLDESLTAGQWCRPAADGFSEIQAFHTPDDIRDLIANARSSILLIPAQLVGFTQADIPAKQARQIIKALPFVVEEQLASEVGENHFALIGRQKNTAYACFIEQSLISTLKERYAVDAILPDVMALPFNEGEWSILFNGSQVLVRTARYEGFSCHSDNLMLLLDHAQHNEGQAVVLYCQDPQQISMLLAQIENHGFSPRVEPINAPWNGLNHLHQHWLSSNLLVDEFKTEKTKGGQTASVFKPVAGMLAAALLLFFVSNVWQGLQYKQMAGQVRTASETYFKQLFPGERITSLDRQMRAKLAANNGQGQANFIDLLGLTGATLNTDPALKGIQLTSVRFMDKRGELEIELSAQSIAQIDQLKQALLQQGLQVDINSATSEKETVKALLKVSRHA